MSSRRSLLPALGSLLLVFGACAGPDAPAGVRTSAVIAGVIDPEELGFPISVLERNAALGQLATVDGTTYQGCSGTLIGDRVVLSASHCVVGNQSEWLAGAPPEVVAPEVLAYAVGEDVEAPDCLLQAEQVILHPDAEPSDLGIAHDLSITVLTESVSESCPVVVPLPMPREPTPESLLDARFLQGGFGSTDGTYDFSPLRHFALMELLRIDGMFLTMIDVELGFPTFGDSGSGALYRTDDGRLWNYGVASAGGGASLMFVELGVETAFLDSVIDADLRCGPVDEVGVCRQGSIVRCDDSGFSSVDCTARGAACVVGEDGTPACVCDCAESPDCEGCTPPAVDAGVDAGPPDPDAGPDAAPDAGADGAGGAAGGCGCRTAPPPVGAAPGLALLVVAAAASARLRAPRAWRRRSRRGAAVRPGRGASCRPRPGRSRPARSPAGS